MIDLSLPQVSLTDLAVDRLREAIVIGHFKPGERLVERAVSASLGISRAPLREALRVLAADGLVQIRQNRGTYVVCPSVQELESMVLARALAEGAAARLIAGNRSTATLEQLAAILDRQQDAQKKRDTRGLIDHHWEFHRTICLLSGNPFLFDMWNKVSNIIRIYSSAAIYRVAVDNNISFLKSMSTDTPSRAEYIIRSQIIIMSYLYLEKDVPTAIRDYTKTLLLNDGRLVDLNGQPQNAIKKLAGEQVAAGSSEASL